MQISSAGWLAIGFAVGTLGCGEKPTANPCVPGRTVQCPCPQGQRGTQTCTASGSLGPCDCSASESEDACALNNGGCSADATCTVTQDSRTCSCKAGYEGDGFVCTDVDECLSANGNCPAHSICTNTAGARTCTCVSGYHDGGTGDCVPNGTCSPGYQDEGNGTCSLVGSRLPPKLMLVLDGSGSMKTRPQSEAAPYCTTDPNDNDGGGIWSPYDPSYVPGAGQDDCKWNSVKRALVDPSTGVLSRLASKAIFGLMVFPDTESLNTCAEGKLLVPIGNAPGDNLETIRSELDSVAPLGGTPTTVTLQALMSDERFMQKATGQDQIVLLITDGQPNCNPENAPKCEDCNATGGCTGPSACYPAALANTSLDCQAYPQMWSSCWDGVALVAQVKALRGRGIFTCVVGFGSLTATGEAKSILNAAALEGGMARSGDVGYYQADDASELGEALESIRTRIVAP